MKRRLWIVELAICGFAIAIQVVGAIAVRRNYLHHEFRHDAPRSLELASSLCWIAPIAIVVLAGAFVVLRPPHWVWSLLASLACIAALALYVIGNYL